MIAPQGVVASPFQVIPGSYASVLSAAAPPTTNSTPLIVHVRPVVERDGVTADGGFYDFPIYLCSGCLLETPINACPATGIPAAQIALGTGCEPAQDAKVTCCTSIDPATSGALLCGSQVPVKTM
jgi:hypothetical protein